MNDDQPRNRGNRLLGQYIIKYDFQFRYSVYMLLLVAASCIILWFEARMIVSKTLETGLVTNPEAVEQLKLISSLIGKTALLLSGLSFGVTLLLTHFIAGPVYRFEKIFNDMRDGKIGLFARLRGHDEFQDAADALNQGLAGLRNKLQKERESTLKLVDEFSGALGGEAPKMKKMLTEIQNNPQHIQSQLQK